MLTPMFNLLYKLSFKGEENDRMLYPNLSQLLRMIIPKSQLGFIMVNYCFGSTSNKISTVWSLNWNP